MTDKLKEKMLNGLDIFTGIGGLSLALRDWVKPVIYCEIDPYCQGVLLSRMADESLPNMPIWDDIRTLQGQPFNGSIDIIYGGFPCQDISIAGKKKGLVGERSSLIFDMLRVVSEIKPKFLFLENVPQIVKLGGTEIINKIISLGMDCRWACISAASCGAPHKRDRWFLLAYNNCESSWKTNSEAEFIESSKTTRLRYSGQIRGNISRNYWQENKCPFPGMDDGLPFELDRAKALGNAVVTHQAREAFKILIGIKD